ncbi:MAG: DNA mismatch repair endonuclease MutL [Chlorobiales bacterium]|nr:DNA mismatch repair endonuclease MutL [Chlorobiales bacterium]
MSLIKKLPDIVANKISAGEVVQRPASVVKELIENAIDAGADEITLIIKEAGKTLVQIVDNGCGMTEEDAVLCFERFATSKISSVDDLESLHTLGFRGEAMASIASVSQVELKTKRQDDRVGTLVRIDGCVIQEVGKTQTADGTTISVRNLFYNVPARRKFLKTNSTEFKHIYETIQAQSLIYPDMKWRFINDDQEVFSFTTESISDRLNVFFGKSFSDGLIELQETNDFLSLRGYLGKPAMMKRTKNEQFFFVNNRVTQSRVLTHAVMQAYGELMGEREYPFFLIRLQIDPRHIDVNVHPSKMEVKFDDERNVHNMIYTIVKRAISTIDFSPTVRGAEGPEYLRTTEPGGFAQFEFPGTSKRLGYDDRDAEARTTHSLYKDYRASWQDRETQVPAGLTGEFPSSRFDESGEQDMEMGMPLFSPPAGEVPSPEQLQVFYPSGDKQPQEKTEERFIWQLHNKYILTQIKSGLMMIDQHVAHERILYERALSVMESNVPNSQQLLFPNRIELKPWEYEVLKEIKEELDRLGFSLRFFGKRTVLIEGIPPDVRPGMEESILQELLEQYQTYQQNLQLEPRDNIAKSYACRSAIMAGQKLSQKEMSVLIDQLFATSMPYVCPHGRPIIIKISLEELDKMFGRT